eukprot:NODE_748_length_4589_cov_0.257238.p4 type:complete len:105 gc:universal NODE_748_length_4589_cov_0.257238:3529-3843(+)
MIRGIWKDLMNSTHAEWPCILSENGPNLSSPKLSAPHCNTTTLGLNRVIAALIIDLNSLVYCESVIPCFSGTFMLKCLPELQPLSCKLPVPGKKSKPSGVMPYR